MRRPRAAFSSAAERRETACSSWYENSRPIAAPVCATVRTDPKRSSQRGDGTHELAPVADRCNANLPEIFRCQLRQHLPIDLVVAEGWRIALKTQTLQP